MSPYLLDRTSFFAPIDSTYAVQFVPLSASLLYLGRNQAWLKATWDQFLLDTAKFVEKPPKPGAPKPELSDMYGNLLAGVQALLPASGGADVNGTRLAAALKRISGKSGDGKHKFFDGAVNSIAKHFAYTNAALGQVDATVIANIPYYAVFKKGGTRTCVTVVAYSSVEIIRPLIIAASASHDPETVAHSDRDAVA